MGKDKKEKSKSPKKAIEPKKKTSKAVDHSISQDDDSKASMSVETKSPRTKQHIEVIPVSNQEFNEVVEEKLAEAEATIKRVRGNVKKRKFVADKVVPEETAEEAESPVLDTRVYIGNVSPSVTKEDINAFFAPVGKVLEFQPIKHTNKDLSERSHAFSFVTLETPQAVEKAIKQLDGKTMAKHPSHTVQVKKATPKPNKHKKKKTTHEELPKKVEKKVEKVEKKLDKAEKKIEKADKKVEKAEKKIEKDENPEKVEKAEKKVEKAMVKVDKAMNKAHKAEAKVEKEYQKAATGKKARK